MKHKEDLARGWMLKGDSDLATATRTANSEGPYDTACFHAQQAAEKYLKAVLALSGEVIPRTHDLEELQLICIQFMPDSGLQELTLEELSDYAVSVPGVSSLLYSFLFSFELMPHPLRLE